MSSALQMVNENNKIAEWAARISECRNSGLSVREWCSINHVCTQTYYCEHTTAKYLLYKLSFEKISRTFRDFLGTRFIIEPFRKLSHPFRHLTFIVNFALVKLWVRKEKMLSSKSIPFHRKQRRERLCATITIRSIFLLSRETMDRFKLLICTGSCRHPDQRLQWSHELPRGRLRRRAYDEEDVSRTKREI